MQPEGLASPPSLSLSTPGFSTGIEGGMPGIHTHTNIKVIGVSYQSVGRNWGPWWLDANGKGFPFSYPAQKVLDHRSYSLSGSLWNTASRHHSRGQLHYPLSLHRLPPLHLAPTPAPWLLSPVKHLELSFCLRLCFLGNPGGEGTY